MLASARRQLEADRAGVDRVRRWRCRRRRRCGRRSPARRGSAAGAGRSPRRRCRGRRSRRSGRSARRSLGRSSRPSRWASSWRDPNDPDTWIATVASGRSMEKLATLLTTSRSSSPCRNALNSRSRSLTGVSPLITGASSRSPSSSSWSRYCPITSVGSPRCLRHELLDQAGLGAGAGREPVALLGLGGRVGEPLALGQRHPHLDAVGRRDVALRLDVLPRRVVPLRADQREHVALAAVLADQRRGQAEPAAGLQVGGHPEDRRGQQVHLVVDDQPPVAGVEQLEVGVDALPPRGHHLVRRDGDRADLLLGAGVLADLVLGQRRAPEQLVLPLPGRARCW